MVTVITLPLTRARAPSLARSLASALVVRFRSDPHLLLHHFKQQQLQEIVYFFALFFLLFILHGHPHRVKVATYFLLR